MNLSTIFFLVMLFEKTLIKVKRRFVIRRQINNLERIHIYACMKKTEFNVCMYARSEDENE